MINRLKPDNFGKGDGEELHIEATAVVSNGKENAHWSPVSEASFNNKVDEAKSAQAFEEYKKIYIEQNNISITEIEKTEELLLNRFNIFESNRHFHKNSKNEPNKFEFRIESIGVLEPKSILLESIKILKNKINNFIMNLNNNDLTITDSKALHDSIDIEILNEDHTLGNLIQSHFNYFDELNNKYFYENKDNINYIGYYEPHPLDNKIILRVCLTKEYEETFGSDTNRRDEIKKILEDCLKKIISLCTTLIGEVEQT